MTSATGILKINLDAVASNWRLMNEITSTAEVGAVIKANAYSMGAKTIAETLYAEGCRSFFVTTLDEAIEIKSVLNSDVVIYVLAGVKENDEPVFAQENFVPVIYSLEMLHRWVSYGETHNQFLPAAIKVDTGMSRFGLGVDEFLKHFPLVHAKINLVLLMSHLACADDVAHPLNELQLTRFASIVDQVKMWVPSIKSSLANSSGIFLGGRWHFDLVRPGAALYGINPQKNTANPLRQVVHLRLPVLQIKTMETDASVGYSALSPIKQGARLAIVSGGYADGVNRTLGLSPIGKCCGVVVKTIGRISMDATIFDVSHLTATDQEILSAGIDVIDESRSVDDLSAENNALGYEVLTSMGDRYQRLYVRD